MKQYEKTVGEITINVNVNPFIDNKYTLNEENTKYS